MSKLLRPLALAALLAALNLAGMTAVAHAGDETANNHHTRRSPTQGQVGEPWHPRVSVPVRPPEPTGRGGLVASLVMLAATALALSGGLAAKRTGWRVRPGQTT